MPKITPVNIWIFDFDNTLVDGHVDYYISTKILEINPFAPSTNYLPGNHTSPFFTHKNVTPDGIIAMIPENIVSDQCYKALRERHNKERIDLKHPKKMLKLMKKILANGDKIAIATFSRYPEVIKLYLTELGLTTDELENIIIEHGLPIDGGRAHGKNQHIERIVKEIKDKNPGITIGTTTLVDDSPTNVTKATSKGYKAILVPEDNTSTGFLEEIEKEIDLQTANEAEAKRYVLASEVAGVATPAGGGSSSGARAITRSAGVGPSTTPPLFSAEVAGVATPAGGGSSSGARPITRSAGVGPSTTPPLFSEASLEKLRTAFGNIEKFLIDHKFTSIDSKKLRKSLDENKFSTEAKKIVCEKFALPLEDMSEVIDAYYNAMANLALPTSQKQITILQKAIIENTITDEEIRTLPNELLTITDKEGNTPLHTAIQYLRPSLAIALVARLEDDNLASQNAQGNTPLHLIAQTIRNVKDPTVISAAEKLGDIAKELRISTTEELVAFAKELRISTTEELVAFAKASRISAVEGLVAVAEELIVRLGNNIATVNCDGNTALHLAAYDGNRDIAVLLAQNMTPDQLAIKARSGYTALEIANLYCFDYRGETDDLKRATFEKLNEIYKKQPAKAARSYTELVEASRESSGHLR